ncbi:hypothetical protein JD844_003886 [Phrynosoma platyrhinos]|uniref:Sushi domain-containing protein 2 n=1 Tax=Phrynosoma platyrhinos TaxID=52577 RepID=A0ABQ7TDD7_PHRPL|nr:hypothetical protein JD844_003886 [Phrynosoma platyrhinos]
MQENSSDVVEIRIQEHSDQLEILLNQKPLNFSEQTWMDLKGLFLSATPGKKATVMFSSGAGAEVSSQPGRVLSVTLLLPEEFLNHTQGLFGMMNGDPRDDLAFRNGTTLDASRSSPEQLLAFGADWAIRNESSLFTYDTQDLLVTFFYGPKHNSSFVPEFSPSEDPSDPLVLEMAVLCQSDPFCRFDVLTTRDLAVGNGTRLSHLSYRHLKERLQPVVSCSWVAPPMNGSKNGTNYLAGSTVHFRCDPGFSLAGSTARVCQDNGIWSGLPASCLPNIGTRWAPGPFASAPCIVLSFLSLAVALGTMA